MNQKRDPKNTTSWGSVAGWYDEMLENKDGTYQKEVVLPNLMRILGVTTAPGGQTQEALKGKTVLDLACGQGFFSRALAEAGATVIGSDIAKELIGLATLHSPKTIQYHVAPADQIDFCAPASVDIVTLVLAAQNIENIQGVFREVYRVLKPGGRFLIVMNHPAYRIPKRSSWQWDANDPTGAGKGEKARGAQYRRIDAYMSESRERIEMNPGEENQSSKKFTVSFHRPLQIYFKNLTKAGFLVGKLEEWVSHKKSNPGPRADEEDRIRKEIPIFLFLEARKI